MMKILFIGDSITKGTMGVSYVKQIRREFPSFRIKNAGANGETLNRIAFRLLEELKQGSRYDLIVLQAGYNDIILPSFLTKGKLYRFGYKAQIRKGMVPLTTAGKFEQFLSDTLMELRRRCNTPVILTMIGPLNESQSSPLNGLREAYNAAIKRVGESFNCKVAETDKLFQSELSTEIQKDYMMNNFWNTTILDPVACCFRGGADSLSRRRKLSLTIDGAHLNTRGAAIFSNEIIKLFPRNQSISYRQETEPSQVFR